MEKKKFIQYLFTKRSSFRDDGQAEMMANLLDTVSSDIYSESQRFVFELIQNADDASANSANKVHFEFLPNSIIVSHNGNDSIERTHCRRILQVTILDCIYLRHHNGFVRQRRLERLINSTDYFVIPFTFQLLGEYVMEILEVLDKHVNAKTIDKYGKFISENKKYWQQTEDRMISYWNAYYRRPMHPQYLPPKYATIKDYIGQQIVAKLRRGSPS